jgi:hypothetical protein
MNESQILLGLKNYLKPSAAVDSIFTWTVADEGSGERGGTGSFT